MGVVGSRLMLAQPNVLDGVGGAGQQRVSPAQSGAEMEQLSASSMSYSYMPWISALASLRHSSDKSSAVAEGRRGGRDTVPAMGSTTTSSTAVPHLRPHEVYSLFRAENLPQIRRELQRLTMQQRTTRAANGSRAIRVPVRSVRFLDANEIGGGGDLPLADGVSDAGPMPIDRSPNGPSAPLSGYTSAGFPSDSASGASSRVNTPKSSFNGRKEQLELLVTNSRSGTFGEPFGDMGPRQNTPRSASGRWSGSGSGSVILQRPRQPPLRTMGFKRADEGGPLDEYKSDLAINGIRSSCTPRRQSPAAAAVAAFGASRSEGGPDREGAGVSAAVATGQSNGPKLEIQSLSGEIPERHNTSPTGPNIQ